MDVLSEVLKVVKLQGALFYNGEFSSPWCVNATSSRALARQFAPAAEHVIIFHLLTEGQAFVRLESGERETLNAGDLVMIPHGDPHVMGNGGSAKAVNDSEQLAELIQQGLKLWRLGGGGEVTKFVCGYMACEPELSKVFLSGLPPVFKVSIRNDAAGRWLENSIRFSVEQTDRLHAGGEAVLAKLSEVVFIEALRAYIAHLLAGQTGWLAGASLDAGRPCERSWEFALRPGRTFPPLSQRNSNGLPDALAASTRRADVGLNPLFRSTNRQRCGL